jgi:hypothetical protein
MAYYKNGDHPAAKRELGTALKLDPAFPGAAEAKQTLAAAAASNPSVPPN